MDGWERRRSRIRNITIKLINKSNEVILNVFNIILGGTAVNIVPTRLKSSWDFLFG